MNFSKLAARVLLLVGAFVSVAHAQISLTLKQGFITKYKDRATIEAECTVDKSKGKANPASKDGDMHITVRCPGEIKLPLVAEIMNAKEFSDVITRTAQDEQSQEKVRIVGAWRIWNEHSGDTGFEQGRPVTHAPNSNPDHVFEIRPVRV